MNNDFPCEKCGCCCRKVGLMKGMEAFDRGDGVCKYLKENNTCSIYENRPDICNTRVYYEKNYKDKMSWEDFKKECKKGCKTLQYYDKF